MDSTTDALIFYVTLLEVVVTSTYREAAALQERPELADSTRYRRWVLPADCSHAVLGGASLNITGG